MRGKYNTKPIIYVKIIFWKRVPEKGATLSRPHGRQFIPPRGVVWRGVLAPHVPRSLKACGGVTERIGRMAAWRIQQSVDGECYLLGHFGFPEFLAVVISPENKKRARPGNHFMFLDDADQKAFMEVPEMWEERLEEQIASFRGSAEP